MILSCNACGTLHNGVSRKEAEHEVKMGIILYNRLGPDDRGQVPDIADYQYCHFCGNSYDDFTVSQGAADRSYRIIDHAK